MTILRLTPDDIEAVVSQVKAGRKLEEVAAELNMSVEMAVCAIRQWPAMYQTRHWLFRI